MITKPQRRYRLWTGVDFNDFEADRQLGHVGIPQKLLYEMKPDALSLVGGEEIEFSEMKAGLVSNDLNRADVPIG